MSLSEVVADWSTEAAAPEEGIGRTTGTMKWISEV